MPAATHAASRFKKKGSTDEGSWYFPDLLALVIGIVPFLTDCQSQGRALTLQTGRTIPMKCHWTVGFAIFKARGSESDLAVQSAPGGLA